ncbi:MAG TPA: hypothetical protein VJ717_20190 [Gemmatimonadaceae bacterium]|nr:hypothetical protein [Gemmatimonadaceae bacterium]
MFEEIRQALRDLIAGNVPPNERRPMLADMRETLVRARMGLDDLRRGCEETRRRLAQEVKEHETAERRRALAEQIGDAQTAEIAHKFAAHHAERVAVFQRKLESQEAELALVEGEVTEMMSQLKAAMAGVGAGLRGGDAVPPDPLGGDETLRAELDQMRRAQTQATRDADAEERLAELKRRMGK